MLSSTVEKNKLMKFKPKWNRDETKPLFVYPDPRAKCTMFSFWDPFDLDKEDPVVSCYGPYSFVPGADMEMCREDKGYDTDVEDEIECIQRGRDTYVPPGIFGPYSGVNEPMRAYRVVVPGYRERQWATVLPKPTRQYENSVDVQFHGDSRDCHPRENYLTLCGKVNNGRTFISFPNGINDFYELAKNTAEGCGSIKILQGSSITQEDWDKGADKGWERFLNSGTIDALVWEGRATFWIILTNNRRSSFRLPMGRVFTYAMRMDTVQAEEEDDDERPTAFGLKRKNENGEYKHDVLDVRELNSV